MWRFNLAIEILFFSSRKTKSKFMEKRLFQSCNRDTFLFKSDIENCKSICSIRFNLAIEILFFSSATDWDHRRSTPDPVSISQSRYFSFQAGELVATSHSINTVSISQSRYFSFQGHALERHTTGLHGHVSISQSRYFSFQVFSAIRCLLLASCFNLAIEILFFSRL